MRANAPHARTHARTHARARAHTHTHTHNHTQAVKWCHWIEKKNSLQLKRGGDQSSLGKERCTTYIENNEEQENWYEPYIDKNQQLHSAK